MLGLDGFEVTLQIRGFNEYILIIAQTAFAIPKDVEKIMSSGFDDDISKSILKAQLKRIIRRYTSQQEPI